jgi:hypothetical protein
MPGECGDEERAGQSQRKVHIPNPRQSKGDRLLDWEGVEIDAIRIVTTQ